MKNVCKHCGSRVPSSEAGAAFCCRGCEQVYELIQGEGLEAFYALQDGVGKPVGERQKFDPVLEATLRDDLKAAETEADGAVVEAAFKLSGMSCVGCVWLVERLSRQAVGVVRAKVSLQEQRLYLSWDRGCLDLLGVAQSLADFGYVLLPRGAQTVPWSDLTWRAVLCSVFALNALLLSLPWLFEADVRAYAGLLTLVVLVLAVLSLIVGGSQFMLPALRVARRGGIHYDTLQSIAWLGLFGVSVFSQRPLGAGLWWLSAGVAIVLWGRFLEVQLWRRLSARARAVSISEDGIGGFQRLNALLVPVLLVLAVGLSGGDFVAAAAALLAPNLYLLAVASRYALVPQGVHALGALLAVFGVCVIAGGWLPFWVAPFWAVLSGVGVFVMLWLSVGRDAAGA